jgi:hypothetical protein
MRPVAKSQVRSSRPVAERGISADGQNRRHAASFVRQDRMSERIHPAVKPVQPSLLHPVADCIATHTDVTQLAPGMAQGLPAKAHRLRAIRSVCAP